MEVMTERPSGSTASPSSPAGPKVICSGCPLGKRWRHRWLCPSTHAMKYIHLPSGDQPAEVHAPSGPMDLGWELPSSEMSRHMPHSPCPFISTIKADLRSGEAYE